MTTAPAKTRWSGPTRCFRDCRDSRHGRTPSIPVMPDPDPASSDPASAGAKSRFTPRTWGGWIPDQVRDDGGVRSRPQNLSPASLCKTPPYSGYAKTPRAKSFFRRRYGAVRGPGLRPECGARGRLARGGGEEGLGAVSRAPPVTDAHAFRARAGNSSCEHITSSPGAVSSCSAWSGPNPPSPQATGEATRQMCPETCQAGVASGTRAAQTGQPAGQCDTQQTPPGPARPGHRFRPSHDHLSVSSTSG